MNRLKIFLSSTSKDLSDHRQSLLNQASKMEIDVVSMEEFGAQDGHAVDVSLKELQDCKLFIGVYARRYGYIPAGIKKGISITEMEYEEAVRLNIPRLIFVVDPAYIQQHALLNSHRDDHEKEIKLKLDNFLKNISKERVWDTYSTAEDLASRFQFSLSKWEGWRKPQPPAPSRKMIGRNNLAETAIESLKKYHRLGLGGIGGNGKTLLAQNLAQSCGDYYQAGCIWVSLSPDEKNKELILKRFLSQIAKCAHEGRMTSPANITIPFIRELLDKAPGKLLIIIDNVWDSMIPATLLEAIPDNIDVLITTRDTSISKKVSAFKFIEVPALKEAESIALLKDRIGEWLSPSVTEKISSATFGHPLALEIAAGLIIKKGFDYAEEELPNLLRYNREKVSESGATESEKAYSALTASLSLSYQTLSEGMKYRYRILSVMPSNSILTIGLLKHIWDISESDDEGMNRDLLHQINIFTSLSLLNKNEQEHILLHPLLHTFIKKLINEEEEQLTTSRYIDYINDSLFEPFKEKNWASLEIHFSHVHQVGQYLRDKIRQEVGDPEILVNPEIEFPVKDQEIGLLIGSLRHPDLINSIWMKSFKFISMTQDYILDKVEIGEEGLNWLKMGFLAAKEMGNLDQCAKIFHLISMWYSERSLGLQAISYEERRGKILKNNKISIEENISHLNSLGWSFYLKGEWKTALKHYKKALSLETEHNLAACALHNNVGELYRRMGEKDLAEEHLLKSLQIKTDEKIEKVARTYRILGLVYRDRSSYNKALEYFEKAYELSLKESNLIDQMEALKSMSQIYKEKGQIGEAKKTLIKAEEISKSIGTASAESGIYYAWGGIYRAESNYEKALLLYEKGLEIDKKTGNFRSEGDILHNIALSYAQLKKYDRALEIYHQILVLDDKMGNQGGAAITKSNIGGIYLKRGKTDEAQKFLEEALPVLRKTKNRRIESQTLLSLSEVYQHKGERKRAEHFMKLSQDVFKEVDSVNADINRLMEEADQFSKLNHQDKAIRNLDAAIKLCEQNEFLKSYAAVCQNQLGLIYNHIGKIRSAKKHYEKAALIYQQLGEKKREAEVWNNLGEVYRIQGNTKRASKYYNLALPILRKSNSKNSLADLLNNMALVCSPKESDKRVSLLEECAQLKLAIEYFNGALIAYRNISVGLFREKRNEESLFYLKKAATLLPKVIDPIDQVDSHINIGVSYLDDFGIQHEGLELLKTALAKMEHYGISRSTGGFTPERLQNLITGVRVQNGDLNQQFENLVKIIGEIASSSEQERIEELVNQAVKIKNHEVYDLFPSIVEQTEDIELKDQFIFLNDLAQLIKNKKRKAILKLVLAHSHFRQGLGLLEKEKIEEAYAKLSQALANGLQIHSLYLALGVTEFHRNQTEKAIQHIQKSIQIIENNGSAYFWRGRCLGNNNPKQAFQDFDQSIKLRRHLEPKNPQPREFKTVRTHGPMAERYQKDYGISIDPKVEETYYWRAQYSFLLENLEEAKKDLDYAILLQPNRYMYYCVRAMICMDLEKYKEAQSDLYKATELELYDVNLYRMRAQAFLRDDDPVGSLEDFHWALHIEADKNTLFNRATVFMGLGEYTQANEDLVRVQEIEPEGSKAYYWNGIGAFLLEEFQDSFKLLELAAQKGKLDANILSWMAIIKLNLEENKEALELLEKASYMDSNDFVAMFWMHVVLELSGDAIQAQKKWNDCWEVVKEGSKENFSALRFANRLLILDGKVEEVKESYLSILQREQLELLQIERSLLNMLARIFPTRANIKTIASWFDEQLSNKMRSYIKE